MSATFFRLEPPKGFGAPPSGTPFMVEGPATQATTWCSCISLTSFYPHTGSIWVFHLEM
ncbi:hypothetical protein JCM12107_05550 [Corynebacterium simulans]